VVGVPGTVVFSVMILPPLPVAVKLVKVWLEPEMKVRVFPAVTAIALNLVLLVIVVLSVILTVPRSALE